MDLGANFTSKLETYLLMSKSAKGAAAAKLIQDATSAAGVFVFAELLASPNIQEVCINLLESMNYAYGAVFFKSFRSVSSMRRTTLCCSCSRTRRTPITFVSIFTFESDYLPMFGVL